MFQYSHKHLPALVCVNLLMFVHILSSMTSSGVLVGAPFSDCDSSASSQSQDGSDEHMRDLSVPTRTRVYRPRSNRHPSSQSVRAQPAEPAVAFEANDSQMISSAVVPHGYDESDDVEMANVCVKCTHCAPREKRRLAQS